MRTPIFEPVLLTLVKSLCIAFIPAEHSIRHDINLLQKNIEEL